MVQLEYGVSDLTLLGKTFELLSQQGHIVWA